MYQTRINEALSYYNAASSQKFRCTDEFVEMVSTLAAIRKSRIQALFEKHPAYDSSIDCIKIPLTASEEDPFHPVYECIIDYLPEGGGHNGIADLYTKAICAEPPTTTQKQLLASHYAPNKKKSRILRSLITALSQSSSIPIDEQRYARAADALNPVTIEQATRESRFLFISCNPAYILTASNPAYPLNGTAMLSSCHSLVPRACDNYKTGAISYAVDSTTFVAFTSKPDPEHMYARKTSRQLYHLDNRVVVQSRLYDSRSTDPDITTRAYRQLVQQALSTCFGIPNRWTTTTPSLADSRYNIHYEMDLDFRGYADCEQYAAHVFFPTGTDKTSLKVMIIGAAPVCTNCGRVITDNLHLVEDTNQCSECATEDF